MSEDTTAVPALARQVLIGLAAELEALGKRIKNFEAAILAWHKDNEISRRLAHPRNRADHSVCDRATVTDPTQFHSARQFAAWIGLVPRQNSSGGKQRQGGISKQGDRTLRRLLVLGATAVIRHARTKTAPDTT
jgi:transposase